MATRITRNKRASELCFLYLLSVFAFFIRLFQHELVESFQRHIITIEVIGLLSKNRLHLVHAHQRKLKSVQLQNLPWTSTRNLRTTRG